MNIHSIYALISPLFRRKRQEAFFGCFNPSAATSILDVGGYPWCWSVEQCPARMTFVNLEFPQSMEKSLPPQFRLVKGDARQLEFPDGSFDIAYSNSVIEHLGTYESQISFAREVRRVGKRVWVQTPARWFPIETHLITPLVHYLPKSVQRWLLRYFTIWGWLTKPSRGQVENFLKEVRLLTYKEMKELFPDCQIRRERMLGLTKSFIAVR